MPAGAERFGAVPARERAGAAAAVLVVQIALGFALLSGLRIEANRVHDTAQRLIEVVLPPVPPPPHKLAVVRVVQHHEAAAPKAKPTPLGGSPGPRPAHAPPSVTPVVAVQPSVAPSGGGSGSGPAVGSGSGGGAGGQGYGDSDEGGTDLVQIAGAIVSSDYPRDLRERGVGGRVGVLFTVGPNGRVTGCSVTRSSGVPELDSLTCRLIQQRFRYRPSTDARGRPISDEVEGEQDWVANGR